MSHFCTSVALCIGKMIRKNINNVFHFQDPKFWEFQKIYLLIFLVKEVSFKKVLIPSMDFYIPV